MSDHKARVVEILADAEKKLLEVLADAAREGHYEGIDHARVAAEDIRRVAMRTKAGGVSRRQEGVRDPIKPTALARSRTSSKKRGYPKFTVADGTLIKTGWSKKSKREYTQRIPKESFEKVMIALKRATQRAEGPIGSEVLFAMLEEDAPSMPSYQAYSALGFLQSRSVIRKASRGEYAVPAGIEAEGLQAWHGAELEAK